MNRDWWILIPCIVVLVACVVALSVMRFGKNNATTEYLAPNFATMFKQMTANDNIKLTPTKPFRVTSTKHIVPSMPAFTVENSIGSSQVMTSNNVIGFVFVPNSKIEVTHVQILASCVLNTKSVPRQVSLFNQNTQDFLGGTVIDLKTSIVDANGFYTTPLGSQITLEPGTSYVIVTQSVPFDFVVSNTFGINVQFVNLIQLQTGALTQNATDVAFPQTFPADVAFFVGFKFLEAPLINTATTVFGVEPSNGGVATSPPSYMNGLIASIPSFGTSILVQPGVASNQTDEITIVLPLPTRIDVTKNGLNGLDIGQLGANRWYYIYVVSSDSSNLPTGCLLSHGDIMPQKLPDGYVNYRRIGSAKTNQGELFIPMQQENKGRRRTTFFTGDETLRTVITDGVATDDFVNTPVLSVPPTTTDVVFGVRGRMDVHTQFDTTTPVNAVVSMRPLFEPQQITTLGIPNSTETYGQINVHMSNVAKRYIQYRLFAQPGTGGSVPNSDAPFEKFFIDVFVVKYVEIL